MAYTEANHTAKTALLTAINQCTDIIAIIAPGGTLPTTATDTDLKQMAQSIETFRNTQTGNALDADVAGAISDKVVAFFTDLKTELESVKTTKTTAFETPAGV